MKKLDVCLSPELLGTYNLEGRIVVVIDILRATSCMTTALANGVEKIIPVATLEECRLLQQQGNLAAAERDGIKAEGFDIGNSPFSYMEPEVKGRTVAMTTTNGTLAITMSRAADEIVIGSFLNLSTVADYLLQQDKDVLLLCSGWKGKPNLEDTLFAGAVAERLQGQFTEESDNPMMARTLYAAGKSDLLAYLDTATHVQRLHRLNIRKDIEFCLKSDVYNVLPVLKGDFLVKMEFQVVE
jgi:2-phosphosulfolactate phosphatase